MNILKRVLKWTSLTLIALVVVLFAASEYKIRSAPDATPHALAVSTAEDSVARGELLAAKLGCSGCHGEDMAGRVFIDEPVFARLIAPNLTTSLKEQSIENIEAALRQGIGFDGRPLVVMPSDGLSYLTDDDTADLIAYLKTLPEVANDLPRTFYGPISRLLFVVGAFQTAPALINEAPPLRHDPEVEPQLAHGEYLAMTMCSECHGSDLGGSDEGGFVTPNLTIVAAYTEKQFAHLLKTGEGASRPDLGLMSDVAIAKTQYLDDKEVQALYAFLTDRIP